MAKVELKQPLVDEIKAMLDGAVGAVVVDYRGLTVEQDTKLRKQLREAGVSYKVYKNTLIKRAAEGTEFAALDPHLEGPTALAVSKDDATAPAVFDHAINLFHVFRLSHGLDFFFGNMILDRNDQRINITF